MFPLVMVGSRNHRASLLDIALCSRHIVLKLPYGANNKLASYLPASNKALRLTDLNSLIITLIQRLDSSAYYALIQPIEMYRIL